MKGGLRSSTTGIVPASCPTPRPAPASVVGGEPIAFADANTIKPVRLRGLMSTSSQSADRNLHPLDEKLMALASPNRLRLASQLHEPRTVGDVHLTPTGPATDGNEERTITRQGVRHHLNKLEEVDLVRSRLRPSSQGRDRREYRVNEPAIVALLEELRSRLAPGTGASADPVETEMATGAGTGSRDWPEGPKLVLLQGAKDERVFALRRIDPNPDPDRGWVIGRNARAEIALPSDPYLSGQNTEILHDDGEFAIVDLRVSTNGTRLNDEVLTPGNETPLEHGDLVKVGCSALVFHQR